jgi:hypothetical protein
MLVVLMQGVCVADADAHDDPRRVAVVVVDEQRVGVEHVERDVDVRATLRCMRVSWLCPRRPCV